jgi:hypothetical protein
MTENTAPDAPIPAVALNGKLWPIPQLVWKDLRKCRAELLELSGRINAASAETPAAPDDATDEELEARGLAIVAGVFHGLSNDDFDRLVMRPIHAGLAAGHPELSLDEFYSWPIGEADRQLVWLAVRRQSGLFVFGGKAEEPDAGEAEGTALSPK